MISKKYFFQTAGRKLPNSIDWFILLRIDENGSVIRIASNNSKRFIGNNCVSSDIDFDERKNYDRNIWSDEWNKFNFGRFIFPAPSESFTEKVTTVKDGRFIILGNYLLVFMK